MNMENFFQLNFTDAQVKELSSTGLAHVGDGAYELLCRSYLCCSGDRTVHKLHKDTVNLVRASTQAKMADGIQECLTEEEQGYYRRGKNAHTHAAPKAATAKEYAKATGLEALFGALFLMGRTDRLNELFKKGLEAL